MVAPGVNVQLQTVTMADAPDLARFGAALVIADWSEHVWDTVAVLNAAKVPVGLWRFTQDPRGWPGWPGDYLKRCDLAVFANEPDIEGWPDWYSAAVYAWYYAKGRIVSPAWSDESKRTQIPGPFLTTGVESVLSAHVYPLGRGAANLAAVRQWANGGLVIVTEFGIAGQQQTCLQQLAALGVTEPTWLYSYRARDAQAQPQYNLAGVALTPPDTQGGKTMAPTINDYCTELGPDGSGHARCGLACMVSVEMAYGNKYDPYQRLLQLQAKAPWVETSGMTSDQMIALAQSLGYQASKWVEWPEASAALAAGKKVLCLLDNWYLRPRMYPAGANWDALHWVRLVDLVGGGKYCQVMDSLVYVPGEYPRPYQGPSIVEAVSLQAAIAATTYNDGTPIPEAGVLIWK